MKKTTFILSIILVLTLMLSFTLLACDKDNDDNGETPYSIPEDLAISIEIFGGETKIGTITKTAFDGVEQQKITVKTTKNDVETTTVYIAYSLSALLEKAGVTVPEYVKIDTKAGDGYEKPFDMTAIGNAYISIGVEIDGEFDSDASSPRFITDKNTTSANDIVKNIVKIAFMPAEAGPEDYPIPDGLTIEIGVYEGDELLGTIDNETFDGVEQQKITVTTVKGDVETTTVYIAYSLSALLEKAGVTVPEYVKIYTKADDGNEKTFTMTSIENAFISIGIEVDGEFDEDTSAPRFISNKNTSAGGDIIKAIVEIAFLAE